MHKALYLFAVTTMLTSCSLAPDFVAPDMKVPEQFKEVAPQVDILQEQGRWKALEPLAQEDRGQWWKIFQDSTLDDLQKQAAEANPNLKIAASRVEQARGLAQSRSPSLIPDLDVGANAVRAKPADASNAAFGGQATTLKPYNMFSVGGVLSYELDLLGRVHDGYRAYMFDTQAQEANYRSVLLALQADVAQHYYMLRALDSQYILLRDTLAEREEELRIMQKKMELGAVSESDFAKTQADVATAKTELTATERERNSTQNMLATLLGKMPSEFSWEGKPLDGVPPAIPAGLPSELLARRPDIAAAMANMQAANLRIGVARTAFFPRIALTANGGVESTELGDLFQWSSRSWALGQTAGSAITMPIFDSGRNFGNLDSAKAAYEEAVATYRQQVLVAFRDAENSLSDQRLLAEQSKTVEQSAIAAKRSFELIKKRFEEGDVDHIDLVINQRDSVAAERVYIQTQLQRFVATITLIRALGGGWEEPKPVQETPSTDIN
ncbi:MAG: efflux transporter outer membrane subunit [Rickettsiales bacterium]|nr:efflux transporter outer membrane subunit [Rickettsiales bacterium]